MTLFNCIVQTFFFLQDLSGDPVLLPSVEGFGVAHDVGAVARLGAGDVALAAQLHPRHRQDRPGQTDRLRSVTHKRNLIN